MNRILLAWVLLAGCKAGTPDCATVADKYVAMIGWKDVPKEKRADVETAIKNAVVGACTDDKWSDDARKCMADAANRKTFEDDCGWRLGREARERLTNRLVPLL